MEIKVLDRGFVRLDGFLADDLSVINAARVSFNVRHEAMEPGDDKLIGFLMKEHHGSPFEHNCFRWHIKCPIFVAREWFRHRIGSFNEISGRYVELEPEYYIPSTEAIRTQVGKPGHYTFEPMEDSKKVTFAIDEMLELSAYAYRSYKLMLQLGIAKEVARIILPLNMYTQFYWTVNARSLLNFLSLRNDEAALFEIREFARVVEDEFGKVMPITHQSFIDNNRVAP